MKFYNECALSDDYRLSKITASVVYMLVWWSDCTLIVLFLNDLFFVILLGGSECSINIFGKLMYCITTAHRYCTTVHYKCKQDKIIYILYIYQLMVL